MVAAVNINQPRFASSNMHSARPVFDELVPELKHESSEAEEAKKLMHRLNNELIPQWAGKYKLPAPVVSLMKMGVPFLDDNWSVRILAAMGNEVAEAFKPSMKELGVPKPISALVYYGSWAVALGSCSARAALRSLGQGSFKTLIKSAGQDTVAAIVGPTLIVLAANKLQNGIYGKIKSFPAALKSIIRPFVSLLCSYLTIPRILDPIGIKFGNFIGGLIPDSADKKWSGMVEAFFSTFSKPKPSQEAV